MINAINEKDENEKPTTEYQDEHLVLVSELLPDNLPILPIRPRPLFPGLPVPLEVGEEYSFSRYFKESGNPVILRVLRKEVVEVPAGTFRTIVVQPLIKTSGLFGQGGEAELYFSDDEHRYLVLMRSKVPLVGSLSLHLREIEQGSPLVAPGEANAEELRTRLALPEPRPIPTGGGGGEGGGGRP